MQAMKVVQVVQAMKVMRGAEQFWDRQD